MFEAQPGWGGRLSAWFKQNRLWAIPGAAVIVLAIIIAIAQAGNDGPEIIKLGSTVSPSPALTPAVSPMASPASNPTLTARHAITSYVTASPENETIGQRLYAETILARQSAPITSDLIAATLNTYATLTHYQRSRWEAMARNIVWP